LNCGQVCIAPDYILVHREKKDALVRELIKVLKAWQGDHPEASADFGRIVNKRHWARVRALLEGHGGTIVHGGGAIEADLYIAPTIVVEPRLDSPLMTEEIFGPILPIISVDSMDAAVRPGPRRR
jgi:acyl-CoA reductase-like NAD-dependent aldehyde dehydrogenase